MTPPPPSAPVELLTFRLAQQEYALDIMSVREIRGWTQATSLPHAPPCLKGVINLRGTVLPVLDLACRLGLPARQQGSRDVIIVVHLGQRLTGLLVEAVSDIVTFDAADLQPPPELTGTPVDPVVSALSLKGERMIRVLDLEATINGAESAAA